MSFFGFGNKPSVNVNASLLSDAEVKAKRQQQDEQAEQQQEISRLQMQQADLIAKTNALIQSHLARFPVGNAPTRGVITSTPDFFQQAAPRYSNPANDMSLWESRPASGPLAGLKVPLGYSQTQPLKQPLSASDFAARAKAGLLNDLDLNKGGKSAYKSMKATRHATRHATRRATRHARKATRKATRKARNWGQWRAQ